MMLGFNGGLLGKRRTTDFSAAKGLWFPNEQSVARRENIWPITGDPIANLFPILWYDFADESKVSISDSQITSVTDKGSLGLNLTKSSTGPAYTTAINGRKCVDWGAQGHVNFLRNTASISSIGEIYIVLSTNGVTQFDSFNALVSSTANEGGAQFRVWGQGTSIIAATCSDIYVNRLATNSTSGLSSPCLIRLKQPNSSPFASSSGFQLAQDRSYNFNRGWPGFIGEVVVFASVLETNARTDLENVLATKWGLTLP